MKNLGRRIGATIGMGLLWGAAWFGAGLLVARVPGFYSDLPFALLFAPFGFITGILFSLSLAVIQSRHNSDRMSLWRCAGWGAASGLLLSGIFLVLRGDSREFLVFGPSLAMASAAGAAGSLALARRADRRELGGPSEDA